MDGVQSDDVAKFDECIAAIARFSSELPGQAERLEVKYNGGSRRRPWWCISVAVTAADRRVLVSALVAVDPAGGWRFVDPRGRDAAAPAPDGLAAATDPTYSTYESFQRFLSA
ncbi:hypothetical protein GCM10010988_05880 [Cnuibacter physcomitrellae]|uniref:hypothetical protein n=1 Tax=Cnuibacter physcomitrellae TaxID=1619308 RepID=UPI0012F4D6FA|nr:hypothetical protein [Cnuibacter physcomitrellae]GGI35823.1 hypothetical protein GCM10010988_05880 [Cnuibacter physcomitrellae]